jgi:hypothetical protein
MNQRILGTICMLVMTGAILSALGGCSVNVVLMDGVNIDASTNPYSYIEAPLPDVAEYDCQFAPAADECQ